MRQLSWIIVPVVGTFLYTAALAAQKDQEGTIAPVRLRLGERVQRSISPGQTHAYEIQLDAGDFIEAVVQPRGINIGVSFAGAEGEEPKAAEITGSPDMAETLLVIAATRGPHRIEVPALERRPVSGSYSIVVTTVRPATSEDRLRVQAMRALEAASRILAHPAQGFRERAAEEIEKAIAGFHQAGDVRGECWAETRAATNNEVTSGPEVVKHAERAVALCRTVPGEQFLTTALSARGLTLAYGGDTRAAVPLLKESVELAQQGTRDEVSARINLGLVYGRSGNSELAIEQFRPALELARTLRDLPSQLGILNNLGIATKDLGQFELSASYYAQGLAVARELRDEANKANEANLLNNLGNLYRILGDYTRSRESHEQALILAREAGNRVHEARALNTLGWTYQKLGDIRRARDYFQQALEIRRTLHDPAALASTLDGLGLASHAMGDGESGLKQVEEALQLRRSTADPFGETESLTHKAQIERDRGDLRSALSNLAAAVELTDSLRERMMSPENRVTFVAAEQEQYELYTDVLMQLDAQSPGEGFAARALQAAEHSRARVLVETLSRAQTTLDASLDQGLIEQARAAQKVLDNATRKLADLVASRADAPRVETARSAVDEASRSYADLQTRIRDANPRYAALTRPRALSLAEIQRELIDPQTLLLEFRLGEKQSWLWCVSTNGFWSFALPPRGTIEKAGREIHGLLTARQPRAGETPDARRARIQRADRRWLSASRAFSKLVLGNAAMKMGDAWRGKRLLIVGSGVLEYLPFAALPDPRRGGVPLVDTHEVVYAPAASVISVIRQESVGRQHPARQLAVLADPVFELDDPRVLATGRRPPARRARNVTTQGVNDAPSQGFVRLPFSREEARAIGTFVRAGDRLVATGFDANVENATSGALADYRIVHFATHGVLNTEHPESSGLVLSLVRPDGRTEKGFLGARDIYNLHLRADLVVLSACQTALGKEIRGEGIMGLTRGFMYAGARRVVASLWQVDDLATAELMRHFYRGMLQQKLPPAAALRAAQRHLAAQPQWSAPFYWAGFVIQGEWKAD